MIAASMEADHRARDVAFTQLWSYVIVTRKIPLCPKHRKQMIQRSGGKGRLRYYSCPVEGCDCDAKGSTTKKYGC
jgi:hypothetical protein